MLSVVLHFVITTYSFSPVAIQNEISASQFNNALTITIFPCFAIKQLPDFIMQMFSFIKHDISKFVLVCNKIFVKLNKLIEFVIYLNELMKDSRS